MKFLLSNGNSLLSYFSPPTPSKGTHASSIVSACEKRKSPLGDLGVNQEKNMTLFHSYYFVCIFYLKKS